MQGAGDEPWSKTAPPASAGSGAGAPAGAGAGAGDNAPPGVAVGAGGGALGTSSGATADASASAPAVADPTFGESNGRVPPGLASAAFAPQAQQFYVPQMQVPAFVLPFGAGAGVNPPEGPDPRREPRPPAPVAPIFDRPFLGLVGSAFFVAVVALIIGGSARWEPAPPGADGGVYGDPYPSATPSISASATRTPSATPTSSRTPSRTPSASRTPI